MKTNSKKKSVVTILAILAAVVGAAVAVYTYLKKKAGDIGKQLDYDGNVYYEDDDDVEEDGLYADDAGIPDSAYADEVSEEEAALDEDTDKV